MTSEERRNLELKAVNYEPDEFENFVEDVGLQDWMAEYFNDMMDTPDSISSQTMAEIRDTLWGIWEEVQEEPEELRAAILKFVEDPEALDNFISYLKYHREAWFAKWCKSFDGMVNEFSHFSKINDDVIPFSF